MWHEALEEASRLYFGEHNIEGMLNVLEPLHNMLEEGAMRNNTTIKEKAFIQVVCLFTDQLVTSIMRQHLQYYVKLHSKQGFPLFIRISQSYVFRLWIGPALHYPSPEHLNPIISLMILILFFDWMFISASGIST